MDKDILKQYIDACEAVKETEEQSGSFARTGRRWWSML